MADGMLAREAREARERKDEWSIPAEAVSRLLSSSEFRARCRGRCGAAGASASSSWICGHSAGRRSDGRLEVLSELDAKNRLGEEPLPHSRLNAWLYRTLGQEVEEAVLVDRARDLRLAVRLDVRPATVHHHVVSAWY